MTEKKSIMAYHALLGWDVTTYSVGMKTIKSWSTYSEDCDLLFLLGQIPLSTSAIESAELFFTKLFKVNAKTMRYDETRLLLLGKCSLKRLPPTSDALKQHIKKLHYKTAIWENADKREIHFPTQNRYTGAMW